MTGVLIIGLGLFCVLVGFDEYQSPGRVLGSGLVVASTSVVVFTICLIIDVLRGNSK